MKKQNINFNGWSNGHQDCLKFWINGCSNGHQCCLEVFEGDRREFHIVWNRISFGVFFGPLKGRNRLFFRRVFAVTDWRVFVIQLKLHLNIEHWLVRGPSNWMVWISIEIPKWMGAESCFLVLTLVEIVWYCSSPLLTSIDGFMQYLLGLRHGLLEAPALEGFKMPLWCE